MESDSSDQLRMKRDWGLFTALTFLFGLGFAIYGGVFQNFLNTRYHAGPLDLGRLESFREMPGLLTAITAGTLVALAETHVAGVGLGIAGLGIALTGFMPDKASLIAVTVFWSVGFHLWSTMQPAITLALARGKEGGRHLGRMSAVGSMATLLGLALATLLSKLAPHVPLTGYFLFGGICVMAAAVLCNRLSANASGAPRASFILRREYGIYYLLIFLEGCRRQIFSIFASYALIMVYHVPVSNMLLLQLVNALLISVTAPAIGKLVDRKGERDPLAFYAVSLIIVFLGYARFRNLNLLYVLFLLDNVLFSFSVGYNTYLHRIVRPGELTPCLAMGTTMNHIAAVTVPLLGAYVWQRSNNYQLPFWIGVFVACLALITNRFLPAGPAPQKDSAAV